MNNRLHLSSTLATAVLFLALVGAGGSVSLAQVPLGPTPLVPPPGQQEVIRDQFIVELKPGVARDAFIQAHGFVPLFRYILINGFAARMSQMAASRLAADSRVQSISPDLIVRAFPKPPSRGHGGGSGGSGGTTSCPDTSSAQNFPPQVPTGVQRVGAIDATGNSTDATGLNVPAAVIDTGIDLCHPDLKDNIKGGVNLVDTSGKPPMDDNGHGTHVAGIIGAAANSFGVVGVAPQASLYAVKVLAADGSGALSTVIKGLDWAAQNGMRVANLSLGAFDFSLGSSSLCSAVTNAVAAGVTVVVAAGNSAYEALFFTPANCRDSLTVSAFVDSDGHEGNQGTSFTISGIEQTDDTFANAFSNYSNYCWDLDGDGVCTASDKLLISFTAPGVQILSTMPTYSVTLNNPNGANKSLNYDYLTGTSMAAPHVAGLAARYLEKNPSAKPAEVRDGLTAVAKCYGGTAGSSDVLFPSEALTCSVPWPNDPDSAPEPLAHASGF